MQNIAKIYGTKTGYLITSVACDQAMKTAREIARERGYSVVVADYGTKEIYRITPNGHKWRPPKDWKEPDWDSPFWWQKK